MSRYQIRVHVLSDGQPMTVAGRDAWCLERLLSAVSFGCTPIEQPAPRLSHYAWKVRTKHGVVVETRDGGYGGQFAGTYARYVLLSDTEILRDDYERSAA